MITAENKAVSLLGTMARSFLIQASWNYKGMQNIGFATMTIPFLKKMHRTKGEEMTHEEAIGQTDFFNTHPYMATAIAGLTFNLSNKAKSKKEFLEAEKEAREAYMGPLGAMGDDFFWASLRPLAGCLGVITAMAGRPVLGIVLFLALYNFFHFKVRWESLHHGAGGEEDLADYLKRSNFHGRAILLRKVSLIFLVLLPLSWIIWDIIPVDGPTTLLIIAAFTSLAVFTALAKWLEPRRMVLLTVIVAVIVLNLMRL